MLRFIAPIVTVAATGFSVIAVEAAERAGETTRVQAEAYQKTGAYPFNLRRGDEVFRDANVSTREHGSVSMLFDDGTDMTLGPNTDVVIDEYVYAPGGGGQAAISFGKGVLRMVSGTMPKENVTIDTPVATVGIRGTTFTLALAEPGVLQGWVELGTVTPPRTIRVRPWRSRRPPPSSAPRAAVWRLTARGCRRPPSRHRGRASDSEPETAAPTAKTTTAAIPTDRRPGRFRPEGVWTAGTKRGGPQRPPRSVSASRSRGQFGRSPCTPSTNQSMPRICSSVALSPSGMRTSPSRSLIGPVKGCASPVRICSSSFSASAFTSSGMFV